MNRTKIKSDVWTPPEQVEMVLDSPIDRSQRKKHIQSRIFIYEGAAYMKIVPSKRLFNSTMVHEVCTRGDIFAVNLETGVFTVLPNGSNEKIVPVA